MVHIRLDLIIKFCLFEISYVKRPDHNFFKSSIKGSKKTSIQAFGFDGRGIKQVKNIYGLDIHNSNGRLYGVTMTGQQEYGDDDA